MPEQAIFSSRPGRQTIPVKFQVIFRGVTLKITEWIAEDILDSLAGVSIRD